MPAVPAKEPVTVGLLRSLVVPLGPEQQAQAELRLLPGGRPVRRTALVAPHHLLVERVPATRLAELPTLLQVLVEQLGRVGLRHFVAVLAGPLRERAAQPAWRAEREPEPVQPVEPLRLPAGQRQLEQRLLPAESVGLPRSRALQEGPRPEQGTQRVELAEQRALLAVLAEPRPLTGLMRGVPVAQFRLPQVSAEQLRPERATVVRAATSR